MHAIRLNVSDAFGHESRGRGITEGFLLGQLRAFGIGSPLGTTLLNSELRYGYGSPEGRGKAEVALLFKKRRFGNTDNAKNSDIDFYHYLLDQAWHENSLIVELFDQYSAETHFPYSFFTNQRHYNVNPRKDSNEYYVKYGIKSRLTGKTSIDANVAWLYKTFANNANAQRFNWDV